MCSGNCSKRLYKKFSAVEIQQGASSRRWLTDVNAAPDIPGGRHAPGRHGWRISVKEDLQSM